MNIEKRRGKRMNFFNKSKIYLQLNKKSLQITNIDKRGEIKQDSFELSEGGITELNLLDYLDRLEYQIKKLSIIIPSEQLLIKKVNLPLAAKDKLNQIIQLQVIEQLPYAAQQVYYLHQAEETGDSLRVLVFVVKRDYINKLYELCQEVDIDIQAIIPIHLIFYQMHQRGYREENKLYVDLTARDQHYTFLGEMGVYLRAVSRSRKLEDELQRTVEFIQEEYDLKESLEVIIAGKRVNYSEELALQTQTLADDNDFWQTVISLEKKLRGKGIKEQITGMQVKEEQSMQRRLWILVILILMVNTLSFSLNFKFKRDHLATLNNQLAEIETIVEQASGLKSEYTKSSEELELLESIIDSNHSYLPWLKELSLILEDDVVVNKLNFKGDRLVLLSAQAESATEVMEQLDSSACFTNLNFIGSIEIKETYEEFKIAGDLKHEAK